MFLSLALMLATPTAPVPKAGPDQKFEAMKLEMSLFFHAEWNVTEWPGENERLSKLAYDPMFGPATLVACWMKGTLFDLSACSGKWLLTLNASERYWLLWQINRELRRPVDGFPKDNVPPHPSTIPRTGEVHE